MAHRIMLVLACLYSAMAVVEGILKSQPEMPFAGFLWAGAAFWVWTGIRTWRMKQIDDL